MAAMDNLSVEPNAYVEAESTEHVDEIENEDESSVSPRKRGSGLKSSSENPRRKKQKAGKPLSHESSENDTTQDKENNGRRTSSASRRRTTNESSTDATDFLAGRNINKPNKPPEAGVITRIYAENFMCHRKLTVDLNRNVNFIYGQNGSGKSAILAAIQICLGAGARRTHRARNLKDLVRKDTSSNCAKIRVTLLNKGDDAFQHERYGDHITVERTIALRGGYNGYKLYSAKNIEQSRSKKDLDEMLDKLNIQVENPVAILDQEEAKKFLTGKAKDKYKFFVKATELERIDNTFRNTKEQLMDMEVKSDRLEESLDRDRELVQETKKAYKQHQAIGKLEGKYSKLQINMGWANYKLVTEDEHTKTFKFEKFKEKAEKKRQELTQAEAVTQEADDPNDERRNRLDTLTAEADTMATLKRDLEQQLKKATEPQKALARQFKLLKKEEESINRALLEANQALQAKRDEIVAKAGSAESEQARRNQRMQAAEKKIAEEKTRRNEIKQAVTDALNSYEDLEPEVMGAKQIVSQLENQLRGIEGKIRSMESSSGNSLEIFGRNCGIVKQMVDKATQQGRFKAPVIGPIGFYCKIQPGKEEFAALAEQAIGNGVLDRFIVFNDADRKTFQSIRNRARCKMDCGIFQQSQHARYNIPAPPKGVETVATVVSIQNDSVFNCLIDSAKIETKALSRDKKESEDLLLVKDNNNRNAIRGGNIKEVYFLPNGDNWKVTKGILHMTSNTRRLKKTIGVDMTAAVEDARNEFQSIKENLRQKNLDFNRLNQKHTDYKKQWNIKRRELRNNEREIDQATKEIDEIKAEEAAFVDNDIDTSEEEEEVSTAQAHLEKVKENQEKAQDLMKEKVPEIQQIKDKLHEITNRNEMILNDLDEAQQALSQHYQAIEIQKEKLEKKRQKLEQYEELVSQHTEIVRDAQEVSIKFLDMARKVQYVNDQAERRRKQREDGENGDQMGETQMSVYNEEPTDEDLAMIEIPQNLDGLKHPDYYKGRMEQVAARIEAERQRRLKNGDDEATAYAKYTRALSIFQAKSHQIEKIEDTTSKLKQDMEQRERRWGHFRDHISDFTGMKFNETLHIKGSAGTIEFDHHKEELNLSVYKDCNDNGTEQKDVKALSGGERSFTTIALLLALGESLETPFRVMDEFDVFLDPNARNKVIDLLIEVGREMCHRQFIFITPQDVSNVESSPMLKILQMKPPERRTVAGGQEQQTLDFAPSQQ